MPHETRAFWGKSQRAAAAARTLFERADAEGAINRAYYAMFDAARAALEFVDPDLATAKTHNTILRRFSKYIVMQQGLDRALGRALRLAEKSRLAADYDSQPVSMDEAEAVLGDMETMLTAVEEFLVGGPV